MGDLSGIGAESRGEVAWLDGRFLPRDAFAVPAGDAGFVMGATVTEQLRTFRGRLFLPQPHAERLHNSLRLVGLAPSVTIDELMAAADEVARHNHAVLDATAPGEPPPDLGLVIFATAGDLAAQHGGRSGPPRVGIHSFPLAFNLWAGAYALADREAAAVESGARAILAHADGRISETSTANVAIVRAGRIVVPPATDALSGVSLAFARGLAERLAIPWREESLRQVDLATADEILLTSTPSCLLPATRFDGRAVGSGAPGPVFHRLLAAWSESAGVDIVTQARRHAPDSTAGSPA
jgi:branched-subunit amino acid aminotransferase/4-amino-4-deoxychorismate lyase